MVEVNESITKVCSLGIVVWQIKKLETPVVILLDMFQKFMLRELVRYVLYHHAPASVQTALYPFSFNSEIFRSAVRMIVRVVRPIR